MSTRHEITFPTQPTSTLIKASIVSLVAASVVFITIILPAEYNIDPTGSGKLMGLTVLAEESIPVPIQKPVKEQALSYQKNEATIIIPPNKGVEYKFKMQQYANLTYEWATNGELLYFDFHGEPKGDTTGYFESYVIATNAEMKGSMTVPFEGSHGWYWKNNSDKDVTVSLTTQGSYEVIGQPH